MNQFLTNKFEYIRKVGDIYELYGSNYEVFGPFKSRPEALDFAHAQSINKIRRIKFLERQYAKFEKCNMWSVS